MFKIIPNKKKPLCQAYRCKNNRGSKDRLCPKHRHRHLKETKPLNYYYHTLKSNARRRKKDFSLTQEEFAQFCEEHNYLELKGRFKNCASIDRDDPRHGYHLWNLKILTVSENSRKAHEDKNREYDDLPF